MSAVLHRLGRWCAHHAWRVLAAWAALIAALAVVVGLLGMNLTDAFKIENAESVDGMAILQERLPQAAGTNEPVLFTASDGNIAAHRATIDTFRQRAADITGIAMVTDPFSDLTPAISEDGTHALVQVMGDASVGTLMSGPKPESRHTAQALRALVDETTARDPGVEINLGGNIGHFVSIPLSIMEVIGVGVAALVLLATFGSLLAAGAPLISALIGVGAGMLGILALATAVDINSTTPVLAIMIGLAVGIDYALFIIARAREYLMAGIAPKEAAARATATAGSAVVFAGGTVIVALCGLAVTGIPFLATMGFSAAGVVAIAVAVALTVVPALLGLLGMRALSKKQRAALSIAEATSPTGIVAGSSKAASPRPMAPEPRPTSRPRRTPAQWWADVITAKPAVTTIAVIALLGTAAVPALEVTTGLPHNGTEAVGTPLRDTHDAIAAAYGEGYNSPIIVIGDIVHSTGPVELVDELADRIAQLDGVAKVQLATPNPDATLAFVQIIPEGNQTDPATVALVTALRDAAPTWEEELGIGDIMVTGTPAVAIDIASQLNRALLPFGAVVVGLSLLLLTIVFRSLWVPITATVGYILSLGVAFGAIGVVYGYGWGADFLHVTKTGPVISFLPVIVMGVLFGLAMDYQVFLVSRMREEWIHTGDARAAVKAGFVGSATVVVAAAVIMTAVFAGFIPEGNVQVKPIALALTAGIAADAFLVRMTLIPALMAWLGPRAWGLPAWLDRLLPVVDVEGEGLGRSLEHADWVAAHGQSMLRVDGLRVREGEDVAIAGLSFALAAGQVAVVRCDDPVARAALAAVISGRLRHDRGVVAVGNHVLPDGTASVQGLTAVIDSWDEEVPSHVRLVVIDNPGSRRWAKVADLASRGLTVVVTGPTALPIPAGMPIACDVHMFAGARKESTR